MFNFYLIQTILHKNTHINSTMDLLLQNLELTQSVILLQRGNLGCQAILSQIV